MSLRPQDSCPSPDAGAFVSVTCTVSLLNTPLVSALSVITIVSVSNTSASAPPRPPPFPTYTVTATVSRRCGFRFSSVS